MTTASTQDVPRDPGLRVLGRTLLLSVAAVLAGVLTAVVTAGSPGVAGVAAGGAVTVAVLAFGTVSVHVASAVLPSASLMVALLTYLLQLALLTIVLAGLRGTEAWGSTLSPGWLAGGVILATAAWAVAQLWSFTRARIPVYDVPVGPAAVAGEAGAR